MRVIQDVWVIQVLLYLPILRYIVSCAVQAGISGPHKEKQVSMDFPGANLQARETWR